MANVTIGFEHITTTPKFKRRKVPAIRDFSSGCRRGATTDFGLNRQVTVDQGKYSSPSAHNGNDRNALKGKLTKNTPQKGNHAKRNKAKSSGPLKVERKRTKKPKYESKSKCIFCNKKEHFKANNKEWKDYPATKGKCMERFMLEICSVEDLINH
ncbi:hypothetical protein J1N35_025509 [Gossypium stocksii]|uniref:Uncharacterized protein n=1 Tax=Gossypium stocksii TaxID=47602 RepID=A0A9D3V6Q6_9ROSI|nr:hypothetical protein J1N35_025509 [Gossypium stocksii]